jgi:hypothetical protein
VWEGRLYIRTSLSFKFISRIYDAVLVVETLQKNHDIGVTYYFLFYVIRYSIHYGF